MRVSEVRVSDAVASSFVLTESSEQLHNQLARATGSEGPRHLRAATVAVAVAVDRE